MLNDSFGYCALCESSVGHPCLRYSCMLKHQIAQLESVFTPLVSHTSSNFPSHSDSAYGLLSYHSYRLACGNATTAKMLSYSTLNCTGSPDGSSDFPAVLGCTDSGDTYSSMAECVAGPFEAPSSSAVSYVYSGASECPVKDGADLSIASSYSCGTCVDYGDENYGSYSCDSSVVTMTYYSDSSCTGDSTFSYPVVPVGCTADDNTVTVTKCNMGQSDDTAASTSTDKKELSTETKGASTAVRTAHGVAVAKVKSAVEAALA